MNPPREDSTSSDPPNPEGYELILRALFQKYLANHMEYAREAAKDMEMRAALHIAQAITSGALPIIPANSISSIKASGSAQGQQATEILPRLEFDMPSSASQCKASQHKTSQHKAFNEGSRSSQLYVHKSSSDCPTDADDDDDEVWSFDDLSRQ
ncbi:MAG: hypothetical protein M1816_005775 [Peltula sp. TS41687]|nr:MAG: hypothetical protein M1816_005775 [Peltula sp. TS41687]